MGGKESRRTVRLEQVDRNVGGGALHPLRQAVKDDTSAGITQTLPDRQANSLRRTCHEGDAVSE